MTALSFKTRAARPWSTSRRAARRPARSSSPLPDSGLGCPGRSTRGPRSFVVQSGSPAFARSGVSGTQWWKTADNGPRRESPGTSARAAGETARLPFSRGLTAPPSGMRSRSVREVRPGGRSRGGVAGAAVVGDAAPAGSLVSVTDPGSGDRAAQRCSTCAPEMVSQMQLFPQGPFSDRTLMDRHRSEARSGQRGGTLDSRRLRRQDARGVMRFVQHEDRHPLFRELPSAPPPSRAAPPPSAPARDRRRCGVNSRR